jgi:hypothetical protein
MEVTAATLKGLYDRKVKIFINDNKPNNETTFDAQLDDALHMLSKFLIQRIRAWGIFKDGSKEGYLFGKKKEEEYKYDLSGIKEVYETFKTCVYNPIFGEIDHADITYNIVHQNLVTSNRVMLKDMIDQMVHLYKGTLKVYRPRSWISCPKSDTLEKEIVFTENAKTELANRLTNGFPNISESFARQEVRNDWHAIFTYIFGPPYFETTIVTPQSVIEKKVVGTITPFRSGGKSTRRARTKKARRAKRHTRRAARREYRGR